MLLSELFGITSIVLPAVSGAEPVWTFIASNRRQRAASPPPDLDAVIIAGRYEDANRNFWAGTRALCYVAGTAAGVAAVVIRLIA